MYSTQRDTTPTLAWFCMFMMTIAFDRFLAQTFGVSEVYPRAPGYVTSIPF